MEIRSNPARALAPALAVVSFAAMMLIGAAPSDARSPRPPAETVTISGKAYRFNHMDTFLPGATIRVRELPKLKAITAENGDYTLKVPDDRNVTPYIESGSIPPGTDPLNEHYNEIDLQTFHPRGEDIVNANFQVPTDLEYEGLKALLQVPADENGRLEQCAIVTTASDRDVRGVDYQTFWDRTKTDANGVHGHGVPGATAISVPSLGPPTYFNDNVIPDATKTATSSDGGIIWSVVPAGSYRIITSHPTKRFASFLASCENGRIINANPPWGAYELAPGEKPLAASNVAGKASKLDVGVGPVVVKPENKNLLGARSAYAWVVTAERLTVRMTLRSRGRKIVDRKFNVKPGARAIHGNVRRTVPPGWGRLRVILTDASGVTVKTEKRVRLARVLKKPKKR